MRGNVHSAYAYNCAAEAQEKDDDEDGEDQSKDVAAAGEIVALPVYILRSWGVVVGDQKGFVVENSPFIRFVHAAAATAPHAVVGAGVEKIVFVEVS